MKRKKRVDVNLDEEVSDMLSAYAQSCGLSRNAAARMIVVRFLRSSTCGC